MSDPKHRSNSSPQRGHDRVPPASPASGKPAESSRGPAPRSASDTQRTKKPKIPLAEENQSGRVKFDERGNPVWEWQTSPGVFETNVTTQRLKKLEAPELSFADTQPVPTIGNKSPTKSKSKEDTGFNPYNSDVPMRPRTDRKDALHPALVHKKPPPSPARRTESQPPKQDSMWGKFKSKFT